MSSAAFVYNYQGRKLFYNGHSYITDHANNGDVYIWKCPDRQNCRAKVFTWVNRDWIVREANLTERHSITCQAQPQGFVASLRQYEERQLQAGLEQLRAEIRAGLNEAKDEGILNLTQIGRLLEILSQLNAQHADPSGMILALAQAPERVHFHATGGSTSSAHLQPSNSGSTASHHPMANCSGLNQPINATQFQITTPALAQQQYGTAPVDFTHPTHPQQANAFVNAQQFLPLDQFRIIQQQQLDQFRVFQQQEMDLQQQQLNQFRVFQQQEMDQFRIVQQQQLDQFRVVQQQHQQSSGVDEDAGRGNAGPDTRHNFPGPSNARQP